MVLVPSWPSSHPTNPHGPVLVPVLACSLFLPCPMSLSQSHHIFALFPSPSLSRSQYPLPFVSVLIPATHILFLILVPFCPGPSVPVILPVSYVSDLVLSHPCHLCPCPNTPCSYPFVQTLRSLCVPAPLFLLQSLRAPVLVPVSWSWFFQDSCFPGSVSLSLHVSLPGLVMP